MSRDPHSNRAFSTRILLLLFLLGAGYGLVSLRRIEPGDRLVVSESPLLQRPPRILEPGWQFLPWRWFRVSEYDLSPAQLRLDLSGEQAGKTREGARVEVEANFHYSISPVDLLALHHARGPGFEEEWLAPLLERETRRRLAEMDDTYHKSIQLGNRCGTNGNFL